MINIIGICFFGFFIVYDILFCCGICYTALIEDWYGCKQTVMNSHVSRYVKDIISYTKDKINNRLLYSSVNEEDNMDITSNNIVFQ